MKIAQIAPLYESVPPKLYGGTERIVHFLTEELVRQGHDVTLFASADSQTTAHLVPGCPSALRLNRKNEEAAACHTLLMERLFSQGDQFDVIHSHMDFLPFPLARRHPTPLITTLHGRLDLPELIPLYKEFREMPVVSISDSQRLPLPFANWQGTVYHGMPLETFHLNEKPQSYVAFLGRFSLEKRVDRAISIAVRAGLPLKIAAKVDPQDKDYYEEVVKPLLDTPGVESIGEITDSKKEEFLGNALGLLFPIDWPEPFGLVMIEAMACGTPVVAYRGGSVPEIIEEGVTGFVVDNEEQAIEAVRRLPTLSRSGVRKRFEERFSVARMAQDYLFLYKKLVGASYPAMLETRSA